LALIVHARQGAPSHLQWPISGDRRNPERDETFEGANSQHEILAARFNCLCSRPGTVLTHLFDKDDDVFGSQGYLAISSSEQWTEQMGIFSIHHLFYFIVELFTHDPNDPWVKETFDGLNRYALSLSCIDAEIIVCSDISIKFPKRGAACDSEEVLNESHRKLQEIFAQRMVRRLHTPERCGDEDEEALEGREGCEDNGHKDNGREDNGREGHEGREGREEREGRKGKGCEDNEVFGIGS
jgi:hypothetical protein